MVYMNPYQYTTYNSISGYLAFAKERDKKVSGIIVVRKDSPYNTLADLKDKTLVFPQEDSFAASLLPRAKLSEESISHKSNYVNSPNSVYRAVYKGNIPAGGGIMQTYSKLNPVVNSNLRVLWKTRQYTPNAFAYHPRVQREQLEKIQAVMTSMHHDRQGSMLLNTLKFNGIEVAKDADWNDIRELQLNLTQ